MKFESKCKTFHSQNCIWRYHLLNGIHFVQGEIRYRTNVTDSRAVTCAHTYRVDSRFVPSQWETSLRSKAISHWLGVKLEQPWHMGFLSVCIAHNCYHASPPFLLLTLWSRGKMAISKFFIQISLKFAAKGSVDNMLALVQRVAWCPPGKKNSIWFRSQNCGCLITWFCYQLIAKPGNKTATNPSPDPSEQMMVWFLEETCKYFLFHFSTFRGDR